MIIICNSETGKNKKGENGKRPLLLRSLLHFYLFLFLEKEEEEECVAM